MEQDELLRFAVEALNNLGLRYLVTGSIATVLYGEPRFTNDIDVVVKKKYDPTDVFKFAQSTQSIPLTL
jgi:hypothetical protein